MYSTDNTPISYDKQDSDWPTILVILSALILISTSSIQLLRERFQSAFKFFILFVTILLFFSFSDIIEAWSDLVNDEAPATDAWNDDWPDEWLGTQIVVFEFKQETISSDAGGNPLLINLEIVDRKRQILQAQKKLENILKMPQRLTKNFTKWSWTLL